MVRASVGCGLLLSAGLLSGCATCWQGGWDKIEAGDVLQVSGFRPESSTAIFRTANRVCTNGVFRTTFTGPVMVSGLNAARARKVIETRAGPAAARIELTLRRDIVVTSDTGYAMVVPYQPGISLADALAGQTLIGRNYEAVVVSSLAIVRGTPVYGANEYAVAELTNGLSDRLLLQKGDVVVLRGSEAP